MITKILVVDDEPDLPALIRQKFRREIRRNQFQLFFANNGVAALEILESEANIDVVLTDINMPEMDGLTLLTRLDELPFLVKAVIISAYGDMENIRTAMNLGAFDFLTKPIDLNDLEITINKTLQTVRQIKTALEQERLARQAQAKLLISLQQEVVEREKAEKKVRESERQLAQFLEGIPVGVFITDAQGTPYYVNQMAQQVLGKGVDKDATLDQISEAYGAYVAGTEKIYPSGQEPLSQALLTGKTVTVDDMEIHQEEKVIPLEVWATPIYDDQNQITYAIAAFQDITARKQAEQVLAEYNRTLESQVAARTQELSQTLEQLQAAQEDLIQSEKMAALGQLVAGVAHEVNTPVGCAVIAASTLMNATQTFLAAQRDGRLKRSVLNTYVEAAQQTSEIVLTNLQRASNLIQNFKQVAVDNTCSDRRKFAVKEYLQLILNALDPQLKPSGLQICILGDEVEIDSYPGAFSQVMTNLVMNSIAHAYGPGETGQLTFSLATQGDRLELQYADDGCGIVPENLSQIFLPFFTTARNRGGHGLRVTYCL